MNRLVLLLALIVLFVLLDPLALAAGLPLGTWNSHNEYSTPSMRLCRLVYSHNQWIVEDRLEVYRETDIGRVEGRADTIAEARRVAERVYERKRYALPRWTFTPVKVKTVEIWK